MHLSYLQSSNKGNNKPIIACILYQRSLSIKQSNFRWNCCPTSAKFCFLSSITHTCLCTELPWSTSGLFQSHHVRRLKNNIGEENIISRLHVSKTKDEKIKVQNAFTVSQILTSVKEITPVMWMLLAITPLDHMYVNVSLDILGMDKTAQVNLIASLQYLE